MRVYLLGTGNLENVVNMHFRTSGFVHLTFKDGREDLVKISDILAVEIQY